MIILNENTDFPDVSQTTFEGLLAIGGNLSIKRLLSAYKKGIFPWFSDDEPILWWSPDPRFVLFPEELHVSKTMKQLLKKNHFEVTINKDFKSVIERCSKTKRVGQDDTWITQDMIDAYLKLHHLGYAKSIEVWQNDELVGGLYGIDLGNNVFCGESMFTKVSNASKVGFITFVQNSNYRLIDCQLHTNHLESLGARNISRSEFVEYL